MSIKLASTPSHASFKSAFDLTLTENLQSNSTQVFKRGVACGLIAIPIYGVDRYYKWVKLGKRR